MSSVFRIYKTKGLPKQYAREATSASCSRRTSLLLLHHRDGREADEEGADRDSHRDDGGDQLDPDERRRRNGYLFSGDNPEELPPCQLRVLVHSFSSSVWFAEKSTCLLTYLLLYTRYVALSIL